MMFKGHPLRLTCIGLFAALLIAAAISSPAQTAGSQGVWRVIILDNETQPRAQEAKRLLDLLRLPSPSYVEQSGSGYRVTYGDYASQAEAIAAGKTLYEKEKIFSAGVINAASVAPPAEPAPAARTGEIYTIFVRDFKDQAEADKLKTKLQAQFGDTSVMIRQIGTFYEVYVGQYDSQQAAVAMGQIRQMGYTTAQVRNLPPAPSPTSVTIVAPPMPLPAGGIDDATLPIPAEEWNKLSEKQKQELKSNAEVQAQIRKGDPIASRMFDIQKRIEGLDDQVKRIIQDIDTKEKSNEKKRREINTLIEDAENLIKSGETDKYKEARLKLDQALNLDKENLFGQRNVILNRITVVDSKLKGLDYPGQDAANSKRIKSIEAEINLLKQAGTADSLRLAISKYRELAELDPNNYKTPAENAIRTLNAQIGQEEERVRTAAADKEKQNQYIIYGMAGAVGVLFIVVLMFGMRSRKRHQELMRKVQEITSIRPMRELEGSGPQLLGGTESDIFTPASPSGEGAVGDPLGGVLQPPPPPDKKGKKKGKGKEAAPVAAAAPAAAAAGDGLDDIFGGGDLGGGAMPDLGGSDSGLDDIFGSPAPAAPKAAASEPSTVQASEPPTVKSPGADIDDIFGGLFADESKPGAPASKPVQQESADADNSPAHDTGPIKLSDFGGGSDSTAGDNTDLLSVFDDSTEVQDKTNGQEVDSLKDSPFGSTFKDTPPPAPPDPDDTEIPSIRLDKTGGDTTNEPASFGGFSLDAKSNPGATTASGESLDLPSFSFDDLVGATSVNMDANPGTDLDFEQDPAGQAPNGWSGEYPFARLTVEADTPPRGAQQYLCFSKPEGAGKAHFSLRFGEVSGVVGIEFDLRCNDKNKFLLGFYIEKDGDFQQSIHTKILRSEAQTSPTIHMQGQSAPYLLGSWTHIKYVVDLKAGKVNGYIDSTHVVRDLPLTPNPGSLNTLSIRDNINTTGVLLLDNIKVYPM